MLQDFVGLSVSVPVRYAEDVTQAIRIVRGLEQPRARLSRDADGVDAFSQT